MKRRFFGGLSFPLVTRSTQGAVALTAAVASGASGPMHDPPLEPRDEAVFLLTAAAEIEHVRDRADKTLAVLVDGSMPCDGSWPPDRIAIFRKWIEDGKQP